MLGFGGKHPMNALRTRLYSLLRSAERYTRIDMVYLAKSGSLLTGADAILAVASLAVSVLVAAFVPKETFGIYRYLIALAGIAAAVSLSGMNNAIARAVAIGREGSFVQSLWLQARFALVQVLVLGAVAAYYFIKGNTTYGISLTAIALISPAASVLNTYSAFLNGKKDFWRMAWWRVEGGLLQSAMLIAVIFTSPTVLGLVIAYFLTSLLTNGFFLWRTFKAYEPKGPADQKDLTYGKHLSVMNAAGILAAQLDALLIYHLLGPVSLATYSFAVLIPDRLRAFAGFIPNSALPKLANRTPEERRATVGKRILLISLAMTGAALVYALVAPIGFKIFFPQYLDAIPYTQFASIFLLSAIPTYLFAVLTAEGSARSMYIVSLTTPFVKIIMSVVGILVFGIGGAIGARILAGVFDGALSLTILRKTAPGKA